MTLLPHCAFDLLVRLTQLLDLLFFLAFHSHVSDSLFEALFDESLPSKIASEQGKQSSDTLLGFSSEVCLVYDTSLSLRERCRLLHSFMVRVRT